MSKNKQLLALDIGEVRIGLAIADTSIGIAVPIDTIAMNEVTFRKDIAHLIVSNGITALIVGYPRNQSGEATQQTDYVIKMTSELHDLGVEIIFQDESLSSVIAKDRLGITHRRIQDKGVVDAEAAAIILQDYLEQQRR